MKNAKKTTNTVNNRKIAYGKEDRNNFIFEESKEFAVNGGKNGFSLNRENEQGAANNDKRKSKQAQNTEYQTEVGDSSFKKNIRTTHDVRYREVTGGDKTKGIEKIDIELD